MSTPQTEANKDGAATGLAGPTGSGFSRSEYTPPERKKYLSEKRKQHNIDRKQAKAIEALGIHKYPLDLPSLDRAVFGDRKPRWLTTGFDWIDKPHRVADSAMQEIRALRAHILANEKAQTRADERR